MNTTTGHPATLTPCPSWCTTTHDGPGAFHAGDSLYPTSPVLFRLWQADTLGAKAGVVVAGEVLGDGEAHELGLALVRAADVLRRARMAASK